MTLTRREVFEALASMSDADAGRRTTVAALAAELDADERTVGDHLDALRACELAVRSPDAGVRVTITGEELLALDVPDVAIVDPSAGDADPNGAG